MGPIKCTKLEDTFGNMHKVTIPMHEIKVIFPKCTPLESGLFRF